MEEDKSSLRVFVKVALLGLGSHFFPAANKDYFYCCLPQMCLSWKEFPHPNQKLKAINYMKLSQNS